MVIDLKRGAKRALVYLRRSTKKQHSSLESQLKWAINKSSSDGIPLDATLDDLAHMKSMGLNKYKAIRMDDGISGFEENRPGRVLLNQDAKADKSISHVYIYKRDRYSRPEDAFEACLLEKKLLYAGLTLIFSDAVSLPIHKGEQTLLRDLELMMAYSQNGEELRKQSERIIAAQRGLAGSGFRTGGNPPSGFIRAFVDLKGEVLERLPRGKNVRQEGCHVVWVPDDPIKIGIWLQVLEWKKSGKGYKWIARTLNEMKIPSPDAGRERTDHGIKHRVSGKWNASTVADLCRNATIIGFLEYGKRSEGMVRRLGPNGHRLLDQVIDYTNEGNLRVIKNDPSLWTVTKVSEPKFDQEEWKSIQQQLDERGKNQRGITRIKDPSRYPLACRLVDMTKECGSFMYARTTHNRAVYTCGKYMMHGSTACSSNQIDAEAMLRFVVTTIKQIIDMNGSGEKLRRKLMERAQRSQSQPLTQRKGNALESLLSQRSTLVGDLSSVEYRMAREKDDVVYKH